MLRANWESRKYIEEHVAEQHGKKKRCHDDDDDDDDDDEDDGYTADNNNVDSGFMSSGNLQYSGEFCDFINNSEFLRQEEERAGKQAATVTATLPSSTTPSLSSSSSVENPMRALDSGVDLTDTLSQLSLMQVSLNALAAKPASLDIKPQGLRCKNEGLFDQYGPTVGKQFMKTPWKFYYTQNDDGNTQLHLAIFQYDVEFAHVLISMAPNPYVLDIPNDRWLSPLHVAVSTHQPEIIRHLIVAGADLTVRNYRGNTPLHVACENGDLECVMALTKLLSETEGSSILNKKRSGIFPQDLEQRNYVGETCLHLATANGHVEVVRLLIDLGADLTSKEGLSGYTALHLAIVREQVAVFNILLPEYKRASCLDVKIYNGQTAYQLTLAAGSEFARNAREQLLMCGASTEFVPTTETDSESEDEEANAMSPYYLSSIVNNTIGVTS